MTENEPGHTIETQPHRRLLSVGVVVSILEDAERGRAEPQKGTTDTEYMAWVGDSIRFGFDTDRFVIKDAATLRGIAAGLDGYFDVADDETSVAARLRDIATELAEKYRQKVEATIAELNQFLAQHEGLFVDEKTGEPINVLTFATTHNGAYELSPELRRVMLAVDVSKLGNEQREIIETALNDPETASLYM